MVEKIHNMEDIPADMWVLMRTLKMMLASDPSRFAVKAEFVRITHYVSQRLSAKALNEMLYELNKEKQDGQS